MHITFSDGCLLFFQINLETWVVVLDFFGIGTSPQKTFKLDKETEESLPWNQRFDVK